MRIQQISIRPEFVLVIPLLLWNTGFARAAPGDIEINQVRAMAGGVTPGDAPGFPVSINEGGNYILTSPLDLTGEPAPQNVTAIEVNVANVTLDMAGKGIIGSTSCTPPPAISCAPLGTGIGIIFNSGGIGSVSHGAISGMGNKGIDMSSSTFGIVKDVGVFNNGGDGMLLPLASTARRVTASANGGRGISMGAGSALLEGSAFSNAGHGIQLGDGSHVKGFTASNNGGSGIAIGSAGLIDSCVANGNGDAGVLGTTGGIVRNCATVVNTNEGIRVAGGFVTLSQNNAYANGGNGIEVGSNSVVSGNVSSLNAGFGLKLGIGTGYEGNTVNSNTGGTVSGASAVETGGNVCAGNSTCP